MITATRTKNMKRRRLVAISLVAALLLAVLPGSAFADKPPQIPAYHNGDIVFFTVVNDNVVGQNAPNANVPIPLYAFGFPPQPQFDVLSRAPGEAGYNPWWKVIIVVVLDGRDVSVNPFTSEAEILAAANAGRVLLVDSGFVFLCQVLP